MSKLGRSKVADDNLESPEVCSTPVAQRSSGIAVDTRKYDELNKLLEIVGDSLGYEDN